MKVRKGQTYVFNASGWDVADRRDYTPENGTKVRVCQPHGCPKNGTMGMCYIESLAGKFIGMVAIASLQEASS